MIMGSLYDTDGIVVTVDNFHKFYELGLDGNFI